MPRAFLIKKKQSLGGAARSSSPKLFSPTSSGIASPNSSNASTASSSPRNDENDHENQFQCSPTPKYSFSKDENQGLDLSMKSLLKEANTLPEKSQKNEYSSVYPQVSYHESTFVSSYPYPAKFAKIAGFLRNGEVSKLPVSPIMPLDVSSRLSAAVMATNFENESLNFGNISKTGNVLPSQASPSGESSLYKPVNFSMANNASQAASPSTYHRLPPYSINWSEHFSVNKMNVSPTPSSQGSDDSGRGSTPSDDILMEKCTDSNKSGKKSDRYQCPDCNKSYSTQSGLAKHQEFLCATQVKKSFSCKHCEKVYVSLGALKMHIRTHTLPCKCKLCGKAFSRPWLLQGHIRTHTGEKPFACQFCNRAFADRSNLRAHLQTHSVVKKYSCKHCSRTFSRMSLLLKHEDNGCNGLRGASTGMPDQNSLHQHPMSIEV